jgi:hypothetical protein
MRKTSSVPDLAMNCHAQYREALLDNNNKSNSSNNKSNSSSNNSSNSSNNNSNNNNNNNNNNNDDVYLQSVETSDGSSASSSTYDASSSDSSSWTDSDDDSNSSSSFDYTQLEFDLSKVLSASKRLSGHHVPTYSASQLLFDENVSSPTMRKSASHHNFLGPMANKSSGNNETSATDLLVEDAASTHLMRKCKSFTNLSSDHLRGLDTDDEGTMASIRDDLLTLAGTLLASRKGDAFRERALVLASINYLARNVPCCVLDHLGREVRQADHRSLFVPDQPSTPTTMASCDSSSSSASVSSSCPTDGGWNLMDDDDSRFTGYRTLTRIQSLDAQTKGVILDLPFVAPFQGVVLFGKPLDGAINDHRIIMACPHLYTILQLTSSVLRNCRPDLARK